VIDLNNVTFGAEYEFGDIWRDRELPSGLSWNTKDYSVVSFTGIANDPKGLVYSRGGEINSVPTSTVGEQLSYFQRLLDADLSPALNHRTNLHLHIRVPGLSEDVAVLKRLLQYIHLNEADIYLQIEPVPVPVRADYESDAAYKGAKKRYKRRLVSHQYKVPETRVTEALQATTPREFFDAHSKPQAKGGRAYGLTTRAGINLLQLKETDTVEFRHFTNTLDVSELESCFTWVRNFIPAALDGASISELVTAYDFKFPKFQPYAHAMEVGYQYTNFDKLSRKVVTERVAAIRKIADIDSCFAEETLAAIKKIDPEYVSQFL